MLIACENQDTKLYLYNGWSFTESSIQLTEGALGSGVSIMRTYASNDDKFIGTRKFLYGKLCFSKFLI